MGRIVVFELRRLFRCGVIGCVVGAFFLYGVAALVFSQDAARGSGVSQGGAALYVAGMMCSQLSVFTVGVLSVHCFSSVTSNGEHVFLDQMGVPLRRVVWARLAILSAVCALSTLALFSAVALCLPVGTRVLVPVAAVSVISVCGIALLGCLVGIVAKNGFVGAFVLFAAALGSSFVNTAASGLFLQFDSNSLTTQVLAALTGWGRSPVCVFGLDLGDSALPLALSVGLAWWLVLAALVWASLRRKRGLS